ncbi:hypothetical protein RSSE_c3142 [Ralstonia solanacearum]|nr:hypothetical protein RSSE_c3142 [Ralstonia solanacearum]
MRCRARVARGGGLCKKAGILPVGDCRPSIAQCRRKHRINRTDWRARQGRPP